MQVGYEKSRFLISISRYRMLSMLRLSGVVNSVPLDCGKLVTVIARVSVQHSSQVHLLMAICCHAMLCNR